MMIFLLLPIQKTCLMIFPLFLTPFLFFSSSIFFFYPCRIIFPHNFGVFYYTMRIYELFFSFRKRNYVALLILSNKYIILKIILLFSMNSNKKEFLKEKLTNNNKTGIFAESLKMNMLRSITSHANQPLLFHFHFPWMVMLC